MIIVSERLFEVRDGSDTYNAIQEYLDIQVQVAGAWADFCQKYGASQYLAADDLKGLLFDNGESVPDGWINPANIGHSRVFRPNLRDKSCANAAKEFKSLPVKPNMFQWLEMLGIPLKVGDRRSFKTPGFKKISGTYYLTAAEGCAVPSDVTEVSSERAATLNAQHDKETEDQA